MENHYAFIATGDIFKLRDVEIFDALAECEIYERNQMIYQQGDEGSCVYYLKNGKVRIYICSASGDEKTLAVFSKGSLFGKSAFFDHMPRSSCAKALSKTEIIRIDKPMMMDIIGKHPEFALDMLEYLSKTIRMFSNQIETMTFLQADRRIAQFIVDNLSEDAKKHEVSCTHEEISSTIGVSRVTVSKILGRFMDDRWIATGYKSIAVTDVKALTDFAFAK